MANFIYLEEARKYVNLEHVSVVTKGEHNGVEMGIVGKNADVQLHGKDAQNVLSALTTHIRSGGRA